MSEERNQQQVLPMITYGEAMDYITARKQYAKKMAIGVMLCILSPVVLIIGCGIGESISLTMDDVMGAVGVVVLLVMVAIAVAIFIVNNVSNRFENIQNGKFVLENSTYESIKQEQMEKEKAYSIQLAVGVVLCILSVIPIILAGALGASDVVATLFVGVLLIIISIGVGILICASIEHDAYKQILLEGEYHPEHQERNARLKWFGGIYWPVVTAIYLAWSFFTYDWYISWAIWPVAGVLFGAITHIVKGVER